MGDVGALQDEQEVVGGFGDGGVRDGVAAEHTGARRVDTVVCTRTTHQNFNLIRILSLNKPKILTSKVSLSTTNIDMAPFSNVPIWNLLTFT